MERGRRASSHCPAEFSLGREIVRISSRANLHLSGASANGNRDTPAIMLESSNWRLEGGSEASIADKDSRVAKSIASYKASLDKETSSLKRSERKSKCSEESIASYRKGSFEEALESFAEYAALIESESIVDPEMRATLYSNIAVCLHQLGEWDLAKLYYDVALAIFETATTSTAAWLYYGDIKQKKVDHINGQKALLGEQKKPAITHYYIDANGRRRGFYDTEASWFSYSSWVAWYFGAADPAVPAAPAAPAP